ncbi:MAG: DUF4249 family protein [Saprospiraceae bacterium]
MRVLTLQISTLFLIVLCFVACEEQYQLDTTDFEAKLVVNSLFSDDDWSVSVSNSNNILDANTKINSISNARVEIFNEDGAFLYELVHSENGTFSRDGYAPVADKIYSIKVTSKGYKTVTATGRVPVLSKLTIAKVLLLENETDKGIEVDFEIEDTYNTDSYYIWEIVELEDEDENEENSVSFSLSDSWINSLSTSSTIGSYGRNDIIGTGVFGNGKYKTTYNSIDYNKSNNSNLDSNASNDNPNYEVVGEIFNTGGGIGNNEGSEETIVYQYELRVMTISKELFDYYFSIQDYLKYTDNNSGQTQYSIYTNINNGLGIFAGYNESVIQF